MRAISQSADPEKNIAQVVNEKEANLKDGEKIVENNDFSEDEVNLSSAIENYEDLSSIAQYDSLKCDKVGCELQYDSNIPTETKTRVYEKMLQFFKNHQEYGKAMETNISKDNTLPNVYKFLR